MATATGAASTSTAVADALATELGRQGGPAPSRTTAQPSASVLWVGLLSEWTSPSNLPDLPNWDGGLVLTNGGGVLLGRTPRGLRRAMWRFLNRLGQYQLAPPAEWEIVPVATANVGLIAGDAFGIEPRFFTGAWRGGGVTATQAALVDTFDTRNGVEADGPWTLGHSWGNLRNQNAAAFALHPEWVGGGGATSPDGNKLCVFEPGLQALMVEWMLDRAATRTGISLSASDGSLGWPLVCSGTNEQATTSPADRQITFANVAQDAMPAGKHVVVQGYGDTTDPAPTVPMRPQIVVIYATGYVKAGKTPEDVVADYRAVGAELFAPYSYLGVRPWDMDEPGAGRATQRSELVIEAARTTGVGWNGEGAPTMLYWRWYWALYGGAASEDIVNRFDRAVAIAFPSAVSAATTLHTTLSERKPLSTDMINRASTQAIALLDALLAAPANERVRALDVCRYVAALDLWRKYKVAPSATTLEAYLRRVARDKNRMHISFLYDYDWTWIAADRKAVAALYGQADLNPNSLPWADAQTTEADIRTALTTAIADNPTLPFTPKSFSTELVKPTAFNGDTRSRDTFVYMIKPCVWYLIAPSSSFEFTAKGGMAFNDKGPDIIKAYDHTTGALVATFSIPEDQVRRSYSFATEVGSTYRIEVAPAGGVDMDWVGNYPMTRLCDENKPGFQADYAFYFYVPKATTTVGVFCHATGVVVKRGTGATVQTLNSADTYFAIAVPGGADGEVWEVEGANQAFALMTVPTATALHPSELLLPEEVVAADNL